MLLLPSSKILKYRLLITGLVISILVTTFLFTAWLPQAWSTYEESSFFNPGNLSDIEKMSTAASIDFFPFMIVGLFFIIILIVLGGGLLYWTPSLSYLTKKEGIGEMQWNWRRFGFPERIFTLRERNTIITIKRKRSSLTGVFMNEFSMEIYISSKISDVKMIHDFMSIEKKILTPTYHILSKTVKPKNLPLSLLQARAILASLVDRPHKANS
ncbi:MAG: hypothetical protein ACXAC8_14295 [Candidatus Hodarchaeales archaeon]|jgi:hypothetical protein